MNDMRRRPTFFEHRARSFVVVAILVLLASVTAPAWGAVCNDCPPTTEGGGGGSPTPARPPMVSMQLDQLCLAGAGGPLALLRTQAAGAITGAFARLREEMPGVTHPSLWPDPDVRTWCPELGRVNVAIWFQPPGAYGANDTEAYRENATRNLDLQNAGETFAIRVDTGAIAIIMDIVRAYAQKEVDASVKGTMLENDVVLHGPKLSYNAASRRVITRADGHVKGQLTGENTDFWLVMTDTFGFQPRTVGLQNGSLRTVQDVTCVGSTAFDYGSSVDTVVAGMFVFLVDHVLDPISDALNGGADLNTDVQSLVNGQTRAIKGPGCGLKELFTRQELIPNTTTKVVFDYRRVTASSGLTGAGQHFTAPRAPWLMITAPSIVYVETGQTPSATVRVTPHDLRGPIATTWQTPGGTRNGSTVTWNVSVAPGQQVSRTVTVSMTDADGQTVSAQRSIMIRHVDLKPDTGCLGDCDGNSNDSM